MKGVIRTTRHAYEKALERFPQDFPTDRSHEQNCGRISAEVAEAVDLHRMSTRLPRWALKPGLAYRGNHKKASGQRRNGGERRFVWTEDEARLYVIRRFPRRDHGRATVVVVTVIRPQGEEIESEAA